MTEAIHPCCNSTLRCPIWEGSPTGEIIVVDGIETYVSKPEMRNSSRETPSQPGLRRAILFLTEAHGIYLPNAQLLADSFATSLDCDVIMPDLFATKHDVPESAEHVSKLVDSSSVIWTEDKNDLNYEHGGIVPPCKINSQTSDAYPYVKPPGSEEQEAEIFENWKRRHEPSTTDPVLASVVQYIHNTYGPDVKIGGVGYCFGGRYVLRLMGSCVIDIGVVNHPSFFTMEEVEGLEASQKLAMYAAAVDGYFPAEKRRQTEDLLGKGGIVWQSTVFAGTEHGFSVRGDLSVKEVKLAKEAAFRGAVEWFRAWL